MDGPRFDELTRSLATGFTRRRTLKTLVAGMAGAALGAVSLDGAEARKRCRTVNQICRKPGDCCDNFCGPKDSTGRQRCGVCPEGSEVCGTECCTEGQFCIDGQCCDNPCPGGEPELCCGNEETCIVRQSGPVSITCCPNDRACFDNTLCCAETNVCHNNACCSPSDICVSPNNSSFCCSGGIGCTDNGCNFVCEHSSCDENTPCVAGRTCCDGCCYLLDQDAENCGTCGTVCATGQGCSNGCCTTGFDTDPQNCGGCGNDCGFYLGSPSTPNCCINGVCTDFFSCSA